MLTLTDISDAKRRSSLEKVFFHDILNTATSLYGLLDMLQEYEEGDVKYELEYLVNICERLVGEISAQRDLVAAENGELLVLTDRVDPVALLEEAAAQFRRSELEEKKSILTQRAEGPLDLTTDHRLLFRIVTNMMKNAMEAIGEGAPSWRELTGPATGFGYGCAIPGPCRGRSSSRCSSAPSPPRARAAVSAPTA